MERSRKIPRSWPSGNSWGSLDFARDDGKKLMRDLPKKIAVLMGGPGSEREVSLATGRGVAKALRLLGAEVVEIDVRNEDFQLPKDVDLAFITIHGTFILENEVIFGSDVDKAIDEMVAAWPKYRYRSSALLKIVQPGTSSRIDSVVRPSYSP